MEQKNNELEIDKKDNNMINTNVDQPSIKSFSLLINPKEIALVKVILSELSVINSTSTNNDKIHIFSYIVTEYIRLSKYLLNSNKIDEFIMLTEWISYQFEKVAPVFNYDLLVTFVIEPLIDFKKDLIEFRNAFFYNSFVTIIYPIIRKYFKL